MHTHSVENRYILIVCAALFLLVAPLFALFFYLSAERSMHERLDRADVAMTTNAQALGKPLWDFDLENVRKVAATVISEPGIVAVRVGDSSGEVDIRVPQNMTLPQPGLRHLWKPIYYSSPDGQRQVGQLDVYLENGGLLSTVSSRDVAFIAIFALAVLIVFTTSLIVNRVIVIRPLLRLTEAIAATRNLGSRHQVDWNSKDEMGVLARNFNEMQKELAREEAELKSAHALVQSIYNQTPAMLYSLDGAGKIVSVSDYWLRAAGYRRIDVVGRPFAEFIDPATQEVYAARLVPEVGGPSTPGVTVKFICADGSSIDALIRETATRSDTGRSLTLSVMTDVSELKQAEIRNRNQAVTDHLTGLFNRQGFEAALDEKICIADAGKEKLACLFIDLDGFKWINDNLGHAAGDAVLKDVVSRMREQIRPTDIVARLGGDEFAILVPLKTSDTITDEIAGRITAMFDHPFSVEGNLVKLSASLGIALYPTHAASASELLQKADMAMYARKRNGKNGTATFNEDLAAASRRRAEMEQNINIGLREDRFEAWMQPIVDLKTGAISGFEALMRMRHPRKGILPPAEIIAAAEENGSIQAIGDVILRKSIRNIADLSTVPGLERATLAVNISPIQINADLPLKISKALLENGVSADRLVIEITEAVLLQENPDIYDILRTLGQAGIRIALDDFGSGYSSLSYLHRFPVNIVKIDKSFVQAMASQNAGARGKSCLLIEGIKTIAHQIDCKVVAEGIEDEHSRSILTEMGIDFGQGYLFARPMSVEDIKGNGQSKFEAAAGGSR